MNMNSFGFSFFSESSILRNCFHFLVCSATVTLSVAHEISGGSYFLLCYRQAGISAFISSCSPACHFQSEGAEKSFFSE